MNTLSTGTTLEVPILFIIFNRPDTTRRVFEAIRKARPSKLYIAADGPRLNKEGEVDLCVETRRIVEEVDWPCEVFTKFSTENQGCKKGVSSAIFWFFDNVEEGIVLEDDCLPNPSFFSYCAELLLKYRETEKIKLISGDNFQFGKTYGEGSYYFSNFPHIWGWASWRRVWQEYDLEMKDYPEFKKENKIEKIFKNKKIQKFWLKLFENLYLNKVDTWDGQFVYSIYNHGGIVVLPNVNLVSNIGFGANATHTKKADDLLSAMPSLPLGTIIHPEDIIINYEADESFFKEIYDESFFKKVLYKLMSFMNRDSL